MKTSLILLIPFNTVAITAVVIKPVTVKKSAY